MSYAMSQAMSYAMSYVSCDEQRPFLRKKREYTKQKAGACRNPSSRQKKEEGCEYFWVRKSTSVEDHSSNFDWDFLPT